MQVFVRGVGGGVLFERLREGVEDELRLNLLRQRGTRYFVRMNNANSLARDAYIHTHMQSTW